MAELWGGAEGSAVDLVLCRERGTDSGADCEEHPVLAPRPAPKRHSPQAAEFASCSRRTGRPILCSRSTNGRIAPWQVRGKTHGFALWVKESRESQPHGGDPWVALSSDCTGNVIFAAWRLWPSARSRSPRSAIGVDSRRTKVGAANVETDGETGVDGRMGVFKHAQKDIPHVG